MSVVSCPQCGAKNRVDERAREMQPVCGKCGAKLPLAAAGGNVPLVVTDATFADQVLRAGDKPVLVDGWAAWCGPCRMIAPALEELARESNGRYIIAKLNVDENPRTAAHYRMESIPTLLIFKAGQLVDRIVGVQPKQTLAARLAAQA